jgi:phosphoglycolate phosphatase-like HAD superfamily hydrolase
MKTRKIDLVIFDFDDTLLHLVIDWKAVKSEVVKVMADKGMGTDPAERLVPMSNRLSEDPGLKSEIDSIYLSFESRCASGRGYRVIPEMVALVKELRSGGLKLAIASGNHSGSIKEILSQIGLLGSFDIICGRDSVSRNKPAPDQPMLIMGNLGITAGKTLFVGDSVNDEGAAKAAGIAYIKAKPSEAGKIAAMVRKAVSS